MRNSNDLIQRYIYAATKRLPAKQRGDIALELESLVDDMLAERCGGAENASTADVRAVLESLGPPDELGQSYSPDAGRSLVGAPYYSEYKWVLRIVLGCVAVGILVGYAISIITGSAAANAATLLDWLVTLLGSGAFAFTLVTVLYAILQRKGIKLNLAQGLDDLPPVPNERAKISRGESVFGLVFTVLFMVVFLTYPAIFGAYFNGEYVPVFNVPFLQSRWPLILGMGFLGIAGEIFNLYEGRATLRLAVYTAISGALSLVLLVLLFDNASMVNPEFLATLATMELAGGIIATANMLPRLVIGIAGLVYLIEAVRLFYRALRYGGAA